MKWDKKDGRGGKKSKRGKDKNKKGQPKKANGKTQEKPLSAAEEPAPRHWGFQILFPCPMGPQLGSSSWDGCDAHDTEQQEVVPKAAPTPAGSWSSWKEGKVSRAQWDKVGQGKLLEPSPDPSEAESLTAF